MYLRKVELTAFLHIHSNILPDLAYKALGVPFSVFQGNTMLIKSCLLSLSISKERGRQQLENNFMNENQYSTSGSGPHSAFCISRKKKAEY